MNPQHESISKDLEISTLPLLLIKALADNLINNLCSIFAAAAMLLSLLKNYFP